MIHIYLSIYQIIVKPKSKILKSKDHYWVMWKNSKSKMQLYHIKVGSLSKMMKKFFWIRKGRRCLRYCLNADFIGQNWKWKSTKFFFKTKKYTYRPWSKCKKNQKNPGTGPVPGPKVIFTTICTLKNTLRPGNGPMPEFFLNFFYIFFMVYM